MTAEEMKSRLIEAYPDAEVEVMDMTGNQSNYQVRIVASGFEGQSRVQRHKAVMAIFAQELKSGEVHALTIQARSQQEA